MKTKHCKRCKKDFKTDEKYAMCNKCRDVAKSRRSKGEKCQIIKPSGKQCTFLAQKDKHYCKKHEKTALKEENKKNGIFTCASRYSCDERVNGNGVKCEKCLERLRTKDRERKKRPPKKDGMTLCSHGEYKPDVEFIENGKVYKNCVIHRESNRKAEKHRTGNRIRNYRDYESRQEVKEKRKQWKKDHPYQTAMSYMKYRAKKLRENSKQYRSHNRDVQKMWKEKNPEKLKKYKETYYNKSKSKIVILKHECLVKNIKWNLTDEQATKLFLEDCFYCGKKGDEKINSIDRMDNAGDYTVENTCGCCSKCNYMKKSLHWIIFLRRCHHIATHNFFVPAYYIPEAFKDYNSISFSRYKKRAQKKNISFELTKEDFNDIIKDECYICGKTNSDTHRNGIDRVNNNEGYTYENSRSSCASCNYLKDEYSYKTFMRRCADISERHLDTNMLFSKTFSEEAYDPFHCYRTKDYIAGPLKQKLVKESYERTLKNHSLERIEERARNIEKKKMKY